MLTPKLTGIKLSELSKPKLIYLGADFNALTAVRLTRLPNCYRDDRLQELIYLDPAPTDDPIWRKANGR